MNVTKSVNVELDDDSLQALANGESLSVPLDDGKLLVIQPPRSRVEAGADE